VTAPGRGVGARYGRERRAPDGDAVDDEDGPSRWVRHRHRRWVRRERSQQIPAARARLRRRSRQSSHVERRQLATAHELDERRIPGMHGVDREGGRPANGLEAVCEYLRKEVAEPALHEHTDRFIKYIWSVFFFVLTVNILGLLPIPAVSNLIREGKTFQIPSIMQTNRKGGMVTLNDALMELVDAKLVEPKEAYMKSVEKQGFLAGLKAKRYDVSFLGE